MCYTKHKSMQTDFSAKANCKLHLCECVSQTSLSIVEILSKFNQSRRGNAVILHWHHVEGFFVVFFFK